MPVTEKALIIVDDEVSYLNFLGDLMSEHLSCPVLTFARPLAALEAIKRVPVGAIATDYYMPQLNGIEFIKRAREIHPHTPFIIITGHGEKLTAEAYPHLPELRSIINKPFRWRELAEEVIKHWVGPNPPRIKD
jgi:DNA-binding NtrC family response regulator